MDDELFLVVAAADQEINFTELNKYLPGVDFGSLSYCDEECLQSILGCKPGNVNYFAILNDKQKKVKVLFDK